MCFCCVVASPSRKVTNGHHAYRRADWSGGNADRHCDRPEVIIRWLREVHAEREAGVCKLDDYFMVAKIANQIAGFAYAQYYPAFKLAFFSYLVVNDQIPEARACKVSAEIAKELKKHLFGSWSKCLGVVAELDEPATLEGAEKRHAAGRIKHFRQLAAIAGCSFGAIQVEYHQPKLTTEPGPPEVRMRLMFAPRQGWRHPRRLTRSDVERIFRFLAEAIYGDHFENRLDLDRAYRAYLTDWAVRHCESLPPAIDLA